MKTITFDDHRSLFTNVRTRPGMWLVRNDFASVVSFVTGYDEAHSRMLLTGFREWLVTQAGCLDNHCLAAGWSLPRFYWQTSTLM